jgi:spore germination protein KA
LLFGYLLRKLSFLTRYERMHSGRDGDAPEAGEETLNKKLQKNLDNLKDVLGDSNDLKIHSFRFGPDNAHAGALVFIDGLVDNSTLTDAILRPVMSWRPQQKHSPADILDTLEHEVLCAGDINIAKSISDVVSGCLSGDTALLVDGCVTGLVISSKGWEKRGVAEPQSETVVRGPREGFTENLRTNTALIRRKIKSELLRLDHMVVGRKTKTSVCLMYLENVANPKVVETVKYRISRLEVDSILESGYIEEYIEDAPFSPFATIAYSEKPDVVAAGILEGRVAILVDGTPFVLTVPMLFIESFQTSEDYYSRPLYASLTRMLRFVAYVITIFAPAIYITLTAFHQELIPTTLLFTIANAREGTPFPVFVEALIMIFAFEILREAGIRLPRPIGQAISIVGALIMGDAAVSAGLVGAPVVITVAITAVAGFLVPTQNDSSSILRIVMMILATSMGFFGVAMGFLAMLSHLASLTSFGVPYLDSFSHADDMKDSVVRMPLWTMIKRPRHIARGDTTRRHFFVPPLRPYETQDEDNAEGENS